MRVVIDQPTTNHHHIGQMEPRHSYEHQIFLDNSISVVVAGWMVGTQCCWWLRASDEGPGPVVRRNMTTTCIIVQATGNLDQFCAQRAFYHLFLLEYLEHNFTDGAFYIYIGVRALSSYHIME